MADDDISLQASLSSASSALVLKSEHLADVDGNFSFPSDDDKAEPAQAPQFPAVSELQPDTSDQGLAGSASGKSASRSQVSGWQAPP